MNDSFENLISPKYLMKLISDIETTLWDHFKRGGYQIVRFYIEKWHKQKDSYNYNDYWENFKIYDLSEDKIDLKKTLHNMDGDLLIKIAIDLGIETPDFIPSIPQFRNEIKSDYTTASSTFEKAFKQIETNPDIAIGLANSALESIIKEILKDDRIKSQIKNTKTLYDLTTEILKIFQIFPNSDMPTEIKTIGSSLIAISHSIEKIRSDKTDFHGKTNEDYRIENPIYTYFIINCVTTVGLFLNSYFKKKFPSLVIEEESYDNEDIPF